MNEDGVKKIESVIFLKRLCEFEVQEYKRMANDNLKTAWYSDPTFITGGIVISVSLGAMVGYLIANQRH